MRGLLWLLLLLNVTFLCNCQRKRKQPNIIVIYIDDLPYVKNWTESQPAIPEGQSIMYYDVDTPWMDSIRNEGVVIPRSYSNGPLCGPSRFSLLTGRYATRSVYARMRAGIFNPADTGEEGETDDDTTEQSDIITWVQHGYTEKGPYVSINNAKLFGDDLKYNIPRILKEEGGYKTAMIGKWHLLHGATRQHKGCGALAKKDKAGDAILYDQCVGFLNNTEGEGIGFDYVGAFYEGNIPTDTAEWDYSYTHNPEWMVQKAQEFIKKTLEKEEEPFFMYFSTTLTHDPNMYDALFEGKIEETPRGRLQGDEIPQSSEIGMDTRINLQERVTTALDSSTNEGEKHFKAGIIWLDDSIGALLSYLKQGPSTDANRISRVGNGVKNIGKDTLILIMNDHGMPAKGTVYEHGARVSQFIKYDRWFGDYAGKTASDTFTTSGVDVSAVLFSAAGIDDSVLEDDNGNRVIDGVDWHEALLEDLDNGEVTCCRQQYIDIHNTHAIVSSEYKYIFRKNGAVKTLACDKYDDCEGNNAAYPGSEYYDNYPMEEIYDLNEDPTEQSNKIEDESIADVIQKYRDAMISHVRDTACYIADEKVTGSEIDNYPEPPSIFSDNDGTGCDEPTESSSSAKNEGKRLDISWVSPSASTSWGFTWEYSVFLHITILILLIVVLIMAGYLRYYKGKLDHIQEKQNFKDDL